MNLRKAAQQALEALEEYQQKGAPFMSCDAAVDALRAALAKHRTKPDSMKDVYASLRKKAMRSRI